MISPFLVSTACHPEKAESKILSLLNKWAWLSLLSLQKAWAFLPEPAVISVGQSFLPFWSGGLISLKEGTRGEKRKSMGLIKALWNTTTLAVTPVGLQKYTLKANNLSEAEHRDWVTDTGFCYCCTNIRRPEVKMTWRVTLQLPAQALWKCHVRSNLSTLWWKMLCGELNECALGLCWQGLNAHFDG